MPRECFFALHCVGWMRQVIFENVSYTRDRADDAQQIFTGQTQAQARLVGQKWLERRANAGVLSSKSRRNRIPSKCIWLHIHDDQPA